MVKRLVQSHVHVGSVHDNAVDWAGLSSPGCCGVSRVEGAGGPHVPDPDPAMPFCSCHLTVDLVSGQALNTLIVGLLPAAHIVANPGVPPPGEGVIATGQECRA